ncbi:MAG: hypothetical protein CME06_13810 [Gemmatimonadetes bacterium]|nr:hypothetical protein [Gemmatimonadota bacterium]
MKTRGSSIAAGAFVVASALVATALLHAASATNGAGPEQAATARLVRRLGLTDLALFTEARYTRHPSQADLHSAFQDHPISLDHFPSGSLVAPTRDRREGGFVRPEEGGAGR